MAAILNSAILDWDTAILDSDTLLSSLRFTQKHSSSTLTLTQTNSIWLIRWWQPSWILPSWIQPFAQKKLHSFNLTQIDDCSHLEFCHLGFSHVAQNSGSNYFNLTQTHSFSLNLMMAAILNSAMLDSDTANLDSDTLLSCLRLTQKHSSSTLTLTQTNLIWPHRWWQPYLILPSWILPYWIQTLPSCIQTLCYLHSDLLTNTFPPLWPWLKLIQSD